MNLKHEWHNSFWFMQQGPAALGAGAGAGGITSALIATFLANLRTEAFFTCPELSLPEPQLGSEFYFGLLLGILLGFCAGCYWIFFSCTGSTCRNSLGFFELGPTLHEHGPCHSDSIGSGLDCSVFKTWSTTTSS